MATSLVVKVTHALDDPERAHIGCNVAAVALASGLQVHVFLAVEGVRLAQPDVPGRLQLADAPPIAELLDALYAAATITVCTPCASRRGLAEGDFRAGTQLAGSARFVELATADAATALVY
ncbi:MAG: DsrE family protein [Actinomycetota bacterium]|jgi:predicted peroxiredoxin|nr:DsrE family protein [Actinomycetota bacterium]